MTTFYSTPRESVSRFLEPGDQLAVLVEEKGRVTFVRTRNAAAALDGMDADQTLHAIGLAAVMRWATVTRKPEPVRALITGARHGGAHDLWLDIPDVGPRTFQPGDREQLAYRVAVDVDPWNVPASDVEPDPTSPEAIAAAEHADDVYAETGSIAAARDAYAKQLARPLLALPAGPTPADWQEHAEQLAYATLPRVMADAMLGKIGPFTFLFAGAEPDRLERGAALLEKAMPVGWCTRADCGAPSPLHIHQRIDR